MIRRARLKRVGKRGKTLTRLDDLVRKIVLHRDGYRCRRCGSLRREGRGGAIQASHIRGKAAHPNLRFELLNVITLCQKCHFVFWHGNDPEAVVRWARGAIGADVLDLLDLLVKVRKGGRMDLTAVEIYLRMELKKLGGSDVTEAGA